MKTIINEDSFIHLKTLDENTFDSCVTDPPYELGFMGKSWDGTGIAFNVDFWKEVLRTLKPGGHLIAFFRHQETIIEWQLQLKMLVLKFVTKSCGYMELDFQRV